MARRAGKAASRKARQRRVQRPGIGPQAPVAESASSPVPEPAARTPATGLRRGVPARQAVGSQLTDTERSEYHYVERDLRDIAILSVVMAALLGLSWFVIQATGILG
jgi:hypothetical protein